MDDASNFIVTETFGDRGSIAEKLVWDSLKNAFIERNCLAYWRYPVFSASELRKEPDILLADSELGLSIVEVKAIRIEQLVCLQGHRWQYRNFYTEFGNPYQQAEKQLFSLLAYCDREPLLAKRVTSRAMVALPLITSTQWQSRGFDRLPNSPPILFQEDLKSSALIIELIKNFPPLVVGENLTPTQWELLLSVLGGTALYQSNYRKLPCRKNSRRHLIAQTRSRLVKLDLQQEKVAKQIPDGMQRIRGVAGSGKTVLLCQKAALMAIKHPEWQIALVFFSRSLYDEITQQVTKWIGHYSQDRVIYDPQNSNLKILHAWGSKEQPGFYSTVCRTVKYPPLSVSFTTSRQPTEALAEACIALLENRTIEPLFDAILIDEAQDLMANNWHYQGKQPFFWLVYQALRSPNPIKPEPKRLIWAYDELQSLSSLKIPEPGEMLGEELGHLVTGEYSHNIPKTVLLSRCYRCPQAVVFTAYGMAMGWVRKNGLITSSDNFEEWQALGYEIAQKPTNKSQLILKHQQHQAPNLLPQLSSEDIISFDRFSSRQQELTVLAQKLKHNLERENIQPEREILIVVLGNYYDSLPLIEQTAIFLVNQKINIYLPGQTTLNCWQLSDQKDNRTKSIKEANRFWYPGAITISHIHRAKGQEADLVYIIGLDKIARQESNLYLRQQLLVALTRTRGWVNISGIGDYSLYQELEILIKSKHQITIDLTILPQRQLRTSDLAHILQGYALGRTNFRYANLENANLAGLNLTKIDLSEANLTNANLVGTNLTNAKLIAANLTNANLSQANLTNAKLISANLTNTNLTNAKLLNTNLTNTIFDSSD